MLTASDQPDALKVLADAFVGVRAAVDAIVEQNLALMIEARGL